MPKGTSGYLKPKKQTVREIDEAAAPPPTKSPKQPKPSPKKEWWQR